MSLPKYLQDEALRGIKASDKIIKKKNKKKKIRRMQIKALEEHLEFLKTAPILDEEIVNDTQRILDIIFWRYHPDKNVLKMLTPDKTRHENTSLLTGLTTESRKEFPKKKFLSSYIEIAYEWLATIKLYARYIELPELDDIVDIECDLSEKLKGMNEPERHYTLLTTAFDKIYNKHVTDKK